MKEKWNRILELLRNFVKKLGLFTIIVISTTSGFLVGYYYEKMKHTVKRSEWNDVRLQEETSVAVNERGELMIINRKDGSYSVYQDSVGKMIFDVYASKLYYKNQSK